MGHGMAQRHDLPPNGGSLTQQDAVSVEIVVLRDPHASSNDATNSIDLTQPRNPLAAVNPNLRFCAHEVSQLVWG
jgi:hypothetical protein